MKRPRTTFAGALFGAAVIACAGCGSAGDAGSDEVVPGRALVVAAANGSATSTVSLDGDKVVEGKNVFLVDFDPSATTITGASTLMPVHGHGSAAPTSVRTTSGYRLEDVIFNMPGLWEVRIEIDVNGKSDRVVFDVDAP